MYRQNVSLIMTVYNEGDNILHFLRSYKQQYVYASEFIIVDGGSSDNTVNVLSGFILENPALSIRLIVDPMCSKKYSKGPIAKGRNRAISEAKGTIIAATDAGCELDKYWLEEITKPFFEDDAVDVVAGFFTVTKKDDFQNKYADIFVPLEEDFSPSSRSIAFKKTCWAKVGGYPETSYAAEDAFFNIKLLKQGCKFTWNKNALVSWDFAKDKGDLKKKLIQYGYGEGFNHLYIYKYVYRMSCVVFPIIMLPKLLLHGKKKKLDPMMLYFFYFNQCRGFITGAIDRMRSGKV